MAAADRSESEMSDQQFLYHAKRADEAHKEYLKWQRAVDMMEGNALVEANGNEAVAAATLRKSDDRIIYEICMGTRTLKLQTAMMECAMAALHRTPGW